MTARSKSTRVSAGVLLYRRRPELQVFLVHPGGPFWARKDIGAWSLPKGEFAPDEAPLEAARREFEEETGFPIDGDFRPLTPVKQPGGKTIHAWMVEGDCDAEKIRSNHFTIEWPPKSGKRQSFPEVDRASWFTLAEARTRILPGQVPILDELNTIVRSSKFEV